MAAYENIVLEKRDHIAKITLNRPEKLNALSNSLLDDLEAACDEIEADYDVNVVILTGSGRAFSSGFDIAPRQGPGGAPPPATSRWDNANRGHQRILRFHWLRQPVVAAVNGYAIAAGDVLAMSCDIVIASEQAQFGEPELRHMGHSPFTFLPFMIPLKHANWFYLSGETISAQTAERFGMVNQVVPHEQLDDAAWRAAETLARVAPFSAQLMKRSINQTLDKMGYREAFEHHNVLAALMHQTRNNVPEYEELNRIRAEQGLRGFLEHRDGFFRDRKLYK